jgi:zinc D-Ala-D-Ala carboxypeptidase
VRLSPHFTLWEFTRSSTAARLGIDNEPTAEAFANLATLAQGLEEVRELLGHPMRIDSGYRCEALNSAVRGSKNSAHMRGLAADFVCPAFGEPIDIVRAIQASPIKFDQCIEEGAWVHISFAPDLRRQVLTAHFGPQGTIYSQGVS